MYKLHPKNNIPAQMLKTHTNSVQALSKHHGHYMYIIKKKVYESAFINKKKKSED